MSEKWYKNSYRRNLVDMHVHDWNEEFLSKFDPDAYFEYLKTAKVDSVMLYLQSHVGLCYFPTRTGVMHKSFKGREDAMRRLVDRCRKNGMPVVGYYSLIFNTVEEERHPEWRLVSDRATGTSAHQRGSRYGRCCPNNREYREFLKSQISEIFEYFELDGIFYDMTYWSGVCYCESCRQRFETETGISELPDVDDLRLPEAKLFREKRYEWLAEFCRFVTDYTRALRPDVTVSHNNAYEVAGDWTHAVWEGVSDQCDYCSGDLYGDIYDHSFCMKYYHDATKDMPYEYMVSRFAKTLKQHTINKTQTQLDQDVLLVAAHHGANFIIDAMDPVGTLDMRVARLIGNSYERLMPYEKYIKSGDLLGDVAVWYSTTGRYNTEGADFNSRTCAASLSKILNTAHVPFRVTANTRSGELSRYKMVFAPAIAGLNDTHREDIYRYVREGGVFYFSGVEEDKLLREFFDAEFIGMSEHKYTYAAPCEDYEELFRGFNEKYPLAMTGKHPLVKVGADNAEILARLELPYGVAGDNARFASIHSNPPGALTDSPSVMRAVYGKGTVIWSALPIEAEDSYHHRQIMLNILREYLPVERQSVITDAPAAVEVVTFADSESVKVSLVDLGAGEEGRVLSPAKLSVAVEKTPSKVLLLPGETEMRFEFENGRVVFETRALDLFDMYEIKL